MSTRQGWPRRQPTLEAGPDLILRPFTALDVDALVEAHADEEMKRYVPTPDGGAYTRAHAERFALGVTTEMWAEESGCSFVIADTTTDELLGSVGVPHIDYATRQAMLGYWTAPWGRRRGAATAGLRAVSDWLLTEIGLHSIILYIDDANVGSVAVARAAGFTRLAEDAEFDVHGTLHVCGRWTLERSPEAMVCADPDWLTTKPIGNGDHTIIRPRGRMETSTLR